MTGTRTRTDELLALRAEAVARGVSNAHPVVAARALGATIWDVEGREYVDFVGGIGVLNVGHNHPRVVAAVRAQLDAFTHTCFQVVMYEPYLRLAERLNARFPGGGPARTVFLTTGAEATENAVKIARAATNRPAVVSFTHSFHGRTLLGMTMTGKRAYYTQNFGPFAPEVYHAPFPYPLRGLDAAGALDGLRELFRTSVDASRVAAIIVEPVLGEGGFLDAPVEFLRGLRELCDANGILLIADEIQSGVGRTGTFWAVERSGVRPDLLTFAKSVGGGLPLSGVTGRADVMDAPLPGGLGGTYAGNPLACAAGLAVLDLFDEEDVLGRARVVGERLHEALGELARDFPGVAEVRGVGPMAAVELVRTGSLEPDTEGTARVVEEARARGLLLLRAGMFSNVIRVLVPLTATDEELTRGLGHLREAFEAAYTAR
ncbi:4-aminobutyrate--2-oxoglutarate transaminase [Deinococcus pimensis]|uniref:4-aminobutyrate--2-oxoglutarate transaminase n=1 Tax=Deinococcus pimensis TaxID=309888 RepID=UPI000484B23D|nr:4-aminobutyrate--2-oxoglutarate transaminase [Deinococcus pimensis]